jgi:hypothetical protein
VAKAGRIAIALPKNVRGHRLPRGRYRAVVTPADRAGRTGSSRTLALVMRNRGRRGWLKTSVAAHFA